MPQDPNRTGPARYSGTARKIRRTGSARQGFSPLRNSREKAGAAERDAIESAASRSAKAIFTGTRTHFRKPPGSTVNGSQSRSSPDFLAWAPGTCRAERITGSLYLAGRPGGVLHLREGAVDSPGSAPCCSGPAGSPTGTGRRSCARTARPRTANCSPGPGSAARNCGWSRQWRPRTARSPSRRARSITAADDRRCARDIEFLLGRKVFPVTVEMSRMVGDGLLAVVSGAAG